MRSVRPFVTGLLLLTLAMFEVGTASAAGPPARPYPQHTLAVTLDPATHTVTVTDTVIPADGAPAPEGFLLNKALRVTDSEPAVEEVPLGDTRPFYGNNTGAPADEAARLARWRFKAQPAGGRFRVTYTGVVNDALRSQQEEYARGFKETTGLVGAEGVYLCGATAWYPQIAPGLLTFEIDAQGPAAWQLISQGAGSSGDGKGHAHWSSPEPMDEIYLVGGPLRVWRDTAGSVETLAYLHDDDAATARKYLDATAQYLEMYRGLIGPYPYGKFALVENFWETGYGMPSFTLLGKEIIRFPFILSSSYPHEILHNWWGNSVFVDYESGNWCEGLTAYLADHLVQEQRGQGALYRRNTLQKYRDYVRTANDFPLTEFRGRYSAATEAIGYGRMLMGAHMLRRQLGDDGFRRFVAQLYKTQRGKRASFADLQAVAEKVAGRPLARFFKDLAARAGAPVLGVAGAKVERTAAGWNVSGRLVQTQAEDAFAVDVPLVVQTVGANAGTTVSMTAKDAAFSIETKDEPLVLHVDPAFDVFRRLDPRESPPALSMLFGESRVTAVLPSASPDEAAKFRELLKGWESPSQAFDVVTDDAVTELPTGRSVWILGRANRLAAKAFAHEPRFVRTADGVSFDGESVATANHSIVAVVRHPANPDKAIGWIAVDPAAAFAGLGRKLPHYGKYSYLAFEGAEPANMLKGEWAASDSPLRVDLRPTARPTKVPALKLAPEKALAELPPVFSAKNLAAHVAYLAAPEREGRGVGTAGLEAAAAYLEQQFRTLGLEPLGANGSYAQPFTIANGPGGKPAAVRNLVGVLRGTKKEWAGQSVLVSAHYDHLGRGWPEAHKEFAGQLHPGADDNASGVAVLLELARVLAAGEKPQRSIVFALFSAEEAGALGAAHYAEAPPAEFPLAKLFANVNLDTVGRLGAGKVQVLGTGTASEWVHIVRGGSFVTGVESASISGNDEASDQRVFIARGIPAVQFFTGPHDDYHRPGDTVDKVDVPGMVKVAALAKEAVAYLAERPEPLGVTIKGAGAGPGAAAGAAAGAGAPGAEGAPKPPRRVTFGVVPDFAFTGTGVRLGGTTPGSPAEKAGLKEGDVITKLDGKPLASLADFGAALRGMSAGQSVVVTYTRDGKEQTVPVTVIER